MLNHQHIKKYASEAGFPLCGVARARILDEHSTRFEESLAASGPAALGYLVRRPERRLDPSVLLPGARTVVVCALDYDGSPVATPAGKVSAHRREGDYQPRVKAMLATVLERLREDEPGLRGKVCCDTSAILEKAWAVEAGLGWIGRNSLLVNPDLGSFLWLGEIVLDAECDRYDEHYAGSGCGGCRRCVESCPAGALVAPVTVDSGVDNAIIPDVYAVDTGRCISALTIERSRGGTPAEPLHGWIYGCDECQTVCPRQIKNPAASKKKHEFF